MDLEKLAISAVMDCISRTDFLEPFLETGDKIPSWDGHIYFFKDKKHSKEGMTRIPVQVKGQDSKNVRNKDENTILYSVDTRDLRIYYKDGGVIYFVVVISENLYQKKIYYAQLLPCDINEYLKKSNSQDSISVSLQLFPSDNPIEIENKLIRAIKDRQKQFSSINCTDEDLEKYKNSDYQLKFEVSISPDITFLQALNNQQPYWYAKVCNGIEIPISRDRIYLGVEYDVNQQVSVKGRLFFNKYKYKEEKSGKISLTFGKHIHLTMDNIVEDESYRHAKMTHEVCGTLNQQIIDMDFFCEVIRNNGFEIDGKQQYWKQVNAFELLKEKDNALAFLKRFRQALNNAGYTDDLSIEDFDDKTWKLADAFTGVFYNHEYRNFTSLCEGDYYCCVTFGKTVLLLFVSKNKENCKLQNPYEQLPLVCKIIETNETFPLSPFVILNEYALSNITFLDFEVIYNSFINIEMSEAYHGYSTNFLLRVLRASDNGAPLKDKYLDFAIKIAKWLYEKSIDMDYKNKEISLLNFYQVKKRIKQLDSDDINELHALLDDNPKMCIQNKVGLYILTGQIDRAYHNFVLLTEEQQKEFVTFPIMHFWDTEKYPLPQVSYQEDEHTDEAKAKEGTD